LIQLAWPTLLVLSAVVRRGVVFNGTRVAVCDEKNAKVATDELVEEALIRQCYCYKGHFGGCGDVLDGKDGEVKE